MTTPKARRSTPAKAPSTKKAAAAATGPRSSDGAIGAAVRDDALRPSWAQAGDRLTTAQGVRVEDTDNTLRAGTRGPALLEDFHFREKIMHFDHERIPERAVHARGAAAHGEFVLYESMSDVTCARFLCDTATPTPVFLRFSTVVGSRGSADTARDVRGFSTRFYTPEGNFDLVGNNIPVFFIQDAIKFPDLIHAAKPEPDREIPQAQTAHSTFWDFVSLQPESTHMLMWAMSDRAIPRSYRTMEGFGVHTFRLVNEAGETTLVKFHWKPAAGIHGLVWEEAQKLGGIDPDFHRRDLAEAIEAGAFPEWELGLQLLPDSDDQFFEGIDLLDPTKIVPEELAPVQLVGKLTLNRNPANFFAETEQVAFHPGHLVRGIDLDRRPAAPGPALLLPRHPAHPARRTELLPAPDQPAPRRGERQPPRRLRPAGHPRGPGALRSELDRGRLPLRRHRRRRGGPGDRRRLRPRPRSGRGPEDPGTAGVVRRPLQPGDAVLEQPRRTSSGITSSGRSASS